MNCTILRHGKNFFERQGQIHNIFLVHAWFFSHSSLQTKLNPALRFQTAQIEHYLTTIWDRENSMWKCSVLYLQFICFKETTPQFFKQPTSFSTRLLLLSNHPNSSNSTQIITSVVRLTQITSAWKVQLAPQCFSAALTAPHPDLPQCCRIWEAPANTKSELSSSSKQQLQPIGPD